MFTSLLPVKVSQLSKRKEMKSEQLAFTWCPRAGFGFLDQGSLR